LLALPLPLAAVVALTTWPHAELERLAPLLGAADIACVESNGDGTMKQVTILAWVPAPPSVMRQVIVQSERYHEFIPNLSRSTREPLGDGRWKSAWRIELPVSSFEGTNTYSIEHSGDGDAVLLRGDGDARYRYEMLPVGEGTLLVQYGYTDVKHSNAFVRSFLKRQPAMEHGLALSAQMMFVTAMRAEAVKRAGGARGTPPQAAHPPSFAALLERGQVAVMRTAGGEVSVLERIYAAEARVADAITRANEYASFVPGVDKSYRRGEGVYVEMSLPIVTWASTWAIRQSAHAVEGAALDGDLRGARFRWDLSSRSPSETLAVYRVRQELDASSLVLRKLFDFQPSLRLGINVALGLVWTHAMRAHAEGWR
jgi:hypothetical protein